MVEPKGGRRRVGVRFVPRRTAAPRIESGGLVVAEVALRRPEVLPIGLHLVAVRFDRGQSWSQVFDARLGEELPDDHLRSLVITFAETVMPDLTLRVDEVECRPVVVRERPP